MTAKQQMIQKLSQGYQPVKQLVISMSDQAVAKQIIYRGCRCMSDQPNLGIMTLYQNIVDAFLEKRLHDYLIGKVLYIDREAVTQSCYDYLGLQISRLSDGLFETECDLHGGVSQYLEILSSNKKAVDDLFQKYPYWLYRMAVLFNNIEQMLIDMIDDFAEQQALIANQLIHEPVDLKLIDLTFDKGDQHSGKVVVEVMTNKGRLFYKPRSGEIDVAIKVLSDEICQANEALLDFKWPSHVVTKTGIWVEAIDYQPLLDEHIQDYYQRLGQVMALIYALEGNDIHYENLISSGEYPVVVDMETLFTNRLGLYKASQSDYLRQEAVNHGLNSARTTGMLPDVLSVRGEVYNISPMGLRLARSVDIEKTNIHSLEGRTQADLDQIIVAIQKGFRLIYETLASDPTYYIEKINQYFGSASLRFLNRPTVIYGRYQPLLVNPVCLSDADYAIAVTCRLQKQDTDGICYYEQKALLKGDIPAFLVDFSSKNLKTLEGDEIKDYFEASPSELVARRLHIFGDHDLKRQLAIIKQVIHMSSEDYQVLELPPQKHVGLLKISDDQIDRLITSYVDRLELESFRNPINGHHMWMAPQLQDKHYILTDLPNNYYSGSLGVLKALMMCYPGGHVLIDALIDQVQDEANLLLSCDLSTVSLGAFTGIGMYLRYYKDCYTYGKLSLSDYIVNVEVLIQKTTDMIANDKKLDVLDGLAGYALSILSVYDDLKSTRLSDKLIKVLDRCRELLLMAIIKKDGQAYFPLDEHPDRYFTGFAHGSSGILMVLEMLDQLLGRQTSILSDLLLTERALFDRSKGIWFKDNKRNQAAKGWCHGIPGILLGRLGISQFGQKTQRLQEEIAVLYDLCLKKALGSNLTLCHGELGNLIICWAAAGVLGADPTPIKAQLAHQLVYYSQQKTASLFRGQETIGLMDGLAGHLAVLGAIKHDNMAPLLAVLAVR